MENKKEQGDKRYKNLLEKANQLLQERAPRISDEASRDMYLENVLWHYEMMELWKVDAG